MVSRSPDIVLIMTLMIWWFSFGARSHRQNRTAERYKHLDQLVNIYSFTQDHFEDDGATLSNSSLHPSFLPSILLSTDGELYAGTSVDFMGANAAIFRTSLWGSSQHYIRTEAYDQNWLNGKNLTTSSLQHHRTF